MNYLQMIILAIAMFVFGFWVGVFAGKEILR